MKYLFITLIFISKVGLTKDINKQIENFILENPEIIIQSLENYEKKFLMKIQKKIKNKFCKKVVKFLTLIMECLVETKMLNTP